MMGCSLVMGGGGSGGASVDVPIVQGYWDANANNPVIPPADLTNKNFRYIVNVAGSTMVDGMDDWDVGDYITSNGVLWYKTDNTPETVEWNYIDKDANYTAITKDSINCDLSTASFTITLPAAPSVGDRVRVTDANENFASNSLFIDRNGNPIHSQAEDWELDAFRSVVFTYVGGATGWVISF